MGTVVIGELIENKVLPFVARSVLNAAAPGRRGAPRRQGIFAGLHCVSGV